VLGWPSDVSLLNTISNLDNELHVFVQVTQLDSSVEEVTLQEIQLRKAFRSTQIFDQQVS
jgi:hypothetical protein